MSSKVCLVSCALFALTCAGLGSRAKDTGTWTGLLSDERCAGEHTKKPGSKETIQCVQDCVKKFGLKAVLILPGSKILTIANPSMVFDDLGDEVSLTGKIANGAIVVISVSRKNGGPKPESPGKDGETVADLFVGYISDSLCGGKHHKVSEGNSKCVTACLKGGDPVLVGDGKVLKFDAESATKARAYAPCRRFSASETACCGVMPLFR